MIGECIRATKIEITSYQDKFFCILDFVDGYNKNMEKNLFALIACINKNIVIFYNKYALG